jgi:hypothetical protein
MAWFCCWMIALWNDDRGQAEATDLIKPPAWSGNYWGPEAWRGRWAGQLPQLPSNAAISRWRGWGQRVLREGDIVFRLGDARIARGFFPASLFIARATGSPFSHTGIVAIEDESPVVYDCSGDGIQRQPFEVWMLDCVGALGVKRLKPEHRRHIPGVIGYCRKVFEQQVPFDYQFRLDDAAFYCLELTEKAFRSQGMALSEPVRIGDWEHLGHYRLTALAVLAFAALALEHPISPEQPVYLPGNESHGVWASPCLETVFGPEPKRDQGTAPREPGGASLRGDVELATIVVGELHRSYEELPVRYLARLAIRTRSLQGGLSLSARPENPPMTAEHDRLDEARDSAAPWKHWGPYLSERQWGTVREDYSEGGDAWNYFTHDSLRQLRGRPGIPGVLPPRGPATRRAGPVSSLG